jgi:undecaprenyl-diphosphatase
VKKFKLEIIGFSLLIILASAILLPLSFYNLDKGLVISFNKRRTPGLDIFFLCITYSAAILTYSIAGISLILSFLEKFKPVKRKLQFITLAVALSGIMATLIKYSIERIRPYHIFNIIHNLGPGGGWSFPSGHSSDAFVLTAILALTASKRIFVFTGYAWAILVGLSRVYLGVHYPSDVLGGIFVGSSMALLAAYFMKINIFI